MKSIAMLALVLLLVAGGSCSASAQQVKSRQDVLAELAAIELRVTVDRDFAGAETALATLEKQCAETGLAGVLADPVVEATRVRIRSAIEAARRDDGADLQQSVAEALRNDDEITLMTLGTRAAAVIRDTLGRTEGPLAAATLSSRLDWMLRLDPVASLAFFQSEPMPVNEGSMGIVLDKIVQHLPWIVHEGRQPVLERPEWLDCIAAMLESSPALRELGSRNAWISSLQQMVRVLAQRDAFTPRLVTDLIDLMERMDGYAVLAVLDMLSGSWSPSAQPILERFVVDDRQAIRAMAARLLVAADASPGLRSRVRDTDPDVRMAVVDSLGPRKRRINYWREREESPGSGSVVVAAPDDPEARALLATLATDPEPVVRERCVNVLGALPAPVDPAVYRALAADGDPLVRVALSQLVHPDDRMQTELLSTLARDTEPRVVQSVEQRLAREDAKWKTQAEAWMPVLIARLDNTHVSLDRAYFLAGAMNSPAARRACTQLALQRNDPAALRVIATYAVLNDKGLIGSYDAPREWSQLTGAELARLLPLLQSISERLPVAVAYTVPGRELDPSVPAALEPLARDTDRPLRFRLAALGLALHEPTPERQQLLRQLLSDASLAPGTDDSDVDEFAVSAAIGGIAVTHRNAVIKDVLANLPLRPSLRLRVVKQGRLSSPGGDDIARLLLDEWLSGGETWEETENALSFVGETPALADEAMMRRAARSGHAFTAIRTLGRLRDPRFLAILTECLDPTWISLNSNPGRADHALEAVSALQGYMSDTAASILLDAAAHSPYPSVREKALASVEAIGRYRDALAAWQKRTTMTASRDAAIGQLTAIAADASVEGLLRAEALRGLGTLQAVEQMPLIIHALTDVDPFVRQAARTALEKLNATAGGTPSQAASDNEPKKP